MASLAPFVLKRPWLAKMLEPVAAWYTGSAGYRQMGLRYVFTRFRDERTNERTTPLDLLHDAHPEVLTTIVGRRREDTVVQVECELPPLT